MSYGDLAALPPVVDVPTAAAVLGLGRTTAYALIRAGQWPTPVYRVGKLIRIPTAPMLALLETGRLFEAPQSKAATA